MTVDNGRRTQNPGVNRPEARVRAGLSTVVCGFAALAATARAQTFSVIASPGGTPAIGAFHAGTLFGTQPYGGAYAAGTLFALTASGSYTALHDFNPATDGGIPNAGLAADAAGALFGMASASGPNGGGTFFKYGAAGFKTLHGFGASGDGSGPLQGPTEGRKLTYYGTTSGGAIGTNGNLFMITGAGRYTVLHNFMSGSDGHCPFSGVTRDAAGNIYGTTVGRGFGGNPTGSVWKFAPGGTLTTLYVFANGNDGEWPDQAPVATPKGDLYGTTHVLNGGNFAGAVWSIASTGAFKVLHDLGAATDGYAPNSPLILNADGNLYGTTSSGGAYGLGTVFRVGRTGRFTVMHAFSGGSDGGNPTGALVHDTSGAIYGGTGYGTVFKIVPP